MTGWLPEGAAEWGGRPIIRSAAEVAARRRAVLSGAIRSVRVRSESTASVEAVLVDGTGAVVLVWVGREAVPGIGPGAMVTVEGTVLDRHGRLVVLNPLYRFTDAAGSDRSPRGGAQSSTSW